jgi:hypothetical protein
MSKRSVAGSRTPPPPHLAAFSLVGSLTILSALSDFVNDIEHEMFLPASDPRIEHVRPALTKEMAERVAQAPKEAERLYKMLDAAQTAVA